MSTDDVKFNNKKMEKMNKLPKGEFLNVRFDIDDGGGVNSYCADSCSGSGRVIQLWMLLVINSVVVLKIVLQTLKPRIPG